jgi:hypothetical protein
MTTLPRNFAEHQTVWNTFFPQKVPAGESKVIAVTYKPAAFESFLQLSGVHPVFKFAVLVFVCFILKDLKHSTMDGFNLTQLIIG